LELTNSGERKQGRWRGLSSYPRVALKKKKKTRKNETDVVSYSDGTVV